MNSRGPVRTFSFSTTPALLWALVACACGSGVQGAHPIDDGRPTVEGEHRLGDRAFDLQGHRGARGHAPENSLPGFRRALAIGVTTLEMDLALTADGVVVVHHDETLNPDIARDTDGEYIAPADAEPLRHLTAEAVAAVDIGRIRQGTAYAVRFRQQVSVDGARIPTLAAVFALAEEVSGSTIRYNLELKRSPTHPGRTADPETFARAALAAVDAAGVRARVTFQSFDFACLDALRALLGDAADEVVIACLTSAADESALWFGGRDLADYGGSWPSLVAAASCDIWSPSFEDLSAASVREAHSLGLQVIPWTVNAPLEIAEAYALDVDGLISDYPDRVRAHLQSQGKSVPAAFPEP